MARTPEEVQAVRNELVNATLLVAAVIAVPALYFSLSRAAELGWRPTFNAQIVAAIVLWSTALLRNRLSLKTRSLVLLVVFFQLGCLGLWQFGLIGMGLYFFFVFIFMCALFVGRRAGFVGVGISLLAISLAMIGVVGGWISHDFDFNLYGKASSSWLTAIFATLFFAGFSVACLSRFMSVLSSSLVQERERTAELQQTQQELEQHKVQLEAVVEERTAELREANADLKAFSRSVTHDLRGHLRRLRGFSGMLTRSSEEGEDDKQQELVQLIADEAEQMDAMMKDLLKLARISRQEMSMKPVSLDHLAEGIFARLREDEPERQVEVTVEPDLDVTGDRGLLKVVLACGSSACGTTAPAST